MSELENKINDEIEEASDTLRDFESALTDDLSELRQDVVSFKTKKRPFWIVEKLNQLGRRIHKYPSVREQNLDNVIEQVRDLITGQPPSDRMLSQDIRDVINNEFNFIRGIPSPSYTVCPLDPTLRPESYAIIAETLVKLEKLRNKRADAKKIKELIDTQENEVYTREKEPVLDDLVQKLLPELTKELDERFDGLSARSTTKKTTRKLLSSGKVAEFYLLYAIFTEYYKTMKLLYQVLLKEYEELDLLDDNAVREIRIRAIANIAQRLARGEWKGKGAAVNRALFRNERLKEIRKAVHAREHKEYPEPPITALCLSGGGIRSATFGLGVIQALAKHSMLAKFDYLSTVSGGGYIGGWLSAWINRKNKSVAEVERELVERQTGEVEPPQVTHLRSYSNYMSPRFGLGSADTWTLIGVYLRNLLLNWTVVIPIAAGLLLLPRILVEVIAHGDEWVGPAPSTPANILYIVSFIFGIGASFFTTAFRPGVAKFVTKGSFFSQLYKRNDIGMLRSAEPKVVWLCVVPLVIFGIGLTTYWAWGTRGERLKALREMAHTIDVNGDAYWIFGVLTVIFVGFWIFNLVHRRKKRREKFWDKVFVSLLFLACIGVAAFQSYSMTKNVLMFGMVLISLLIFLIGFGTAKAVVCLLSTKGSRGDVFEGFGYELCLSFLAASVSGILMFGAHKIVLVIGERLPKSEFNSEVYATLALPGLLLVYLLAGTIYIGISSKLLDDGDREWMSRIGAWILIFAVGWLAVFSLVLLAPSGLYLLTWGTSWTGSLLASLGGISGIVTLLFGFFARSATEEKSDEGKKRSAVVELLPKIAAPIFGASLIVLLVLGTEALMRSVGHQLPYMDVYADHNAGASALALLLWAIGLLAIGSFMGLWVNINKFSLHAIYRDRIVRAYLGASRGFARLTNANSFTGLDDNDNIDLKDMEHQRPFHVVNMTLNLASNSNLRWQNRKAESFTATPFHCGSSNMGEGSGNYRASKLYGADKLGRPITLGTAIAISGAAASPNMGYFTQSAPVSALMALFNIRLGWWLGNPGGRGRKSYRKNAPDFAPIPMANEAFGRTGDTNSFVYLSDGGHFENLGLYEMVLRRCKLIVLCDAGSDPKYSFSDLGVAIHKIRVDMGVPIEFDDGLAPQEGRYCTRAHIKYTAIDGEGSSDGILIYFKPTLDGQEPIDIGNYKKKAADFPHESTADQMYSETQFECYRQLGNHMMDTICGLDHKIPCLECGDLNVFPDRVDSYLSTTIKKFDEPKSEN